MAKTFYLMRHAESLGNIGVNAGENPGLTLSGEVQATQACAFLEKECGDKKPLILSSPFKRCLLTIQPFAEATGLKVKLEPELHEYFCSEWFNMRRIKLRSLRTISSEHSFVIDEDDRDQWWPLKNEKREDLKMRLAIMRNRLLGNEFKDETIVCVGHWPSVRSLARALSPGTEIEDVPNASITKITFDGKKAAIDYLTHIPYENE